MKSFSDLIKHLTTNHLDVTFYNSVVTYLGRSKFHCIPTPLNSICLISGTVYFLNEKVVKLQQKRARYIIDTHKRYRRIPPSPLNFNE